jgi:two-component system, chemotaxis family, chemotaxis protein CheY
MTETETDSARTVKLPAVLDLEAARGLLDLLKSKSGSADPVLIDAAEVEMITLPCVQILLSAVKPPGAMSVVNPSDALVGAFSDLGIVWNHSPTEQPAPPAAEPAAMQAVEQAVPPPAEPSAAQAADQPSSPPDEQSAQSADQTVIAEDEPRATTDTDGAESEAAMSKRILTIDDSKTMRDMLMLTLKDSGFDVIQAVDGQDGLEVLAREKSVDVIITDINMPKMDGYGVLENVRKNPEYDNTPILVLTTESDKEKKDRARNLGATGFIIKPFNPVSLVEVIRKVSP